MLAIETIQPRDKLYWQARAVEAEEKLAEIRKLLDDHAHIQASLDRFTAAVRALQRGDKQAVAEYLRYLEAKWGRAMAEEQRELIKRCARHPKWSE